MEMGRKTVAAATLLLALASSTSARAEPPYAGGTIAIETSAADDDDDALPIYGSTASRALGDRGFTILNDPGHALYVAELIVTRSDVGVAQTKIAAGRASMLGSGVSIPIARGQSRYVPLQRTELEIRIRRRGEQAVLWHGAAVTVRPEGSRQGADEAIAPALSQAIVAAYPAEPATVIGVP